jgi:cytochrome c-type biogenesis protein CcmH/NrfF
MTDATDPRGATDDRDGPVELYLDEMFDRLSGTGRAGRYALAETENHLRAAVDEEVAAGRSGVEAQHVAVARFGDPVRIARQMRHAMSPPRIAHTVSALWALAGLAALAVAVAFGTKAVEGVVLTTMHPPGVPYCGAGMASHTTEYVVDGMMVGSPACSDAYEIVQRNRTAGLVALLVAVGLLLVRRLAVRVAGLPLAGRRFPLAAAGVFAAAGVLLPVVAHPNLSVGPWLYGYDGGLLGVPTGAGLYTSVLLSFSLLFFALVAVVWYLVRPRRRRSSPVSAGSAPAAVVVR